MPSRNRRKKYPVHQSPFYRMRGKGQFEKVIGAEWKASKKLLSPTQYRVWVEDGREIQKPIGWLEQIHKRIASLFARIEMPDYVYSQKGKSYAQNAYAHAAEGTKLVKTDICKYFPSTTRYMIYRMFRQEFRCAPDIATRLTEICCYENKHLPTGSPISGYIAFFSSRKMFEEIRAFAKKYGCTMTLYVDDIVLSGEKANKSLLGDVRQIVHKYGYKTKDKKSSSYAPGYPKPITGAIVLGDSVLLPNERHYKIWQTRKALMTAADQDEKERLKRSLQGRLLEAKQIIKPK